jgi:hypothetical protein
MKHRARLALLGCLVLLLARAPAFAFGEDAGNPILDTFNIQLGTFFYGTGTTISLNGTASLNGATVSTGGTPIDLEHTLGVQNASRFRLDAYVRFTRHQRLRIMYFDASRSSSRTLDRTFTFGNATYPVGTTAYSQNGVSVTALSYEYDFIVGENFSLGAALGINRLNYNLAISATTFSPSNPSVPVYFNQKAAADGPLPLIGLSAIWRVTPAFYLTAIAQGLKVTVNPYSGTLQNYGMTANWQPLKNFGLGFGYDFFSLRAGVDGHNFNGNLNWRYSGPRVFFSASF